MSSRRSVRVERAVFEANASLLNSLTAKTADMRARYWNEFVTKQSEFIAKRRQTRTEVRNELFDRFAEALETELARLPKGRGASRAEIELAINKISARLGKEISEAFFESAKKAYIVGLDKVGQDFGRQIRFGGVHEDALRASLEGRGVADMFADFTNRTSAKFNDIVEDAYRQGKVDPHKLVVEMIDVVGWEARERLERIAHTEVAKISVEGQVQAYLQMEEERDEEFLYEFGYALTLDTCQACEEIVNESAGGLPLKELRKLIIEKSKKYIKGWNPTRDGWWPWVHPWCVHNITRVVESGIKKMLKAPPLPPGGPYKDQMGHGYPTAQALAGHIAATGHPAVQEQQAPLRQAAPQQAPQEMTTTAPPEGTTQHTYGEKEYPLAGMVKHAILEVYGKEIEVYVDPDLAAGTTNWLGRFLNDADKRLFSGTSRIEVRKGKGKSFNVGKAHFDEGGHYDHGIIRIFEADKQFSGGGGETIINHELAHGLYANITRAEREEEDQIIKDWGKVANERAPIPTEEEHDKLTGQRDKLINALNDKYFPGLDALSAELNRLRTDNYSTTYNSDQWKANKKKQTQAKRKQTILSRKFEAEKKAIYAKYPSLNALYLARDDARKKFVEEHKTRSPLLAALEAFRDASRKDTGVTSYSESYRLDYREHSYYNENFAEMAGALAAVWSDTRKRVAIQTSLPASMGGGGTWTQEEYEQAVETYASEFGKLKRTLKAYKELVKAYEEHHLSRQ